MAHNLMETKKGFAYAGARELAWHKLGVTTKEAMTSEEAIELAQLDYEVGIEKLYASVNGTSQWIDTHNVTYNKRSGDIFGVVGSRYTVIQNKEAFNFLDGIVEEKVAMFETAGALGKGETIFVSVKLPNNIRLKSLPNEEINNYLLFTSSHDGTGSIRVMFTPIRVVCNNTLTAALTSTSGINSWTIKHTKNAKNRLNSIQDLFIKANAEVQRLGFIFDEMAAYRMTEQQVLNVVVSAVLKEDEFIIEDGKAMATVDLSKSKKNTIAVIKRNIYKGVGQDIIEPETAYGVYNGVTTYLQNEKDYKSHDDMFTKFTKKSIADKVYQSLQLEMMK